MSIGAGSLAFDLFVDCVILALPCYCGLLLAYRFHATSRTVQCVFALATPCVLSYLSGACYLISPSVGRAATVSVYGVLFVALIYLKVTSRRSVNENSGFFALVGLMTVAAAACSLGLGYLHGTFSNHVEIPTITTASTRYLRHLPIDNDLPYLFARALLSPHRPIPRLLVSGWSSSDRPPLETGVYLLVRSLLFRGDAAHLHYEVTGVLLQSFWVPAVSCFFVAIGAHRRVFVPGLFTLLVSGFVIVNSFFVWPKLLAGAFVVLVVTLVLTDEWQEQRAFAIPGIACGAAISLSLLSHEGSLLVLVPLGAMIVVRRHAWPRARFLIPAVCLLVILLVPWLLYQSVYSPPGTKLVKQQLAGQKVARPSQSLLSAVQTSYGRLTEKEFLRDKSTNFATPFTGEPDEFLNLYRLASNLFARSGNAARSRNAAVLRLRTLAFYYLLPSVGLLALGPLAQLFARLRRRGRPPGRYLAVVNRIWILLALNITFWAIVLFGPAFTVIHQGSYATELLAFAVTMMSVYELSPVLASIVAMTGGAVGLVVYGVFEPSWTTRLSAQVPTEMGDALFSGVGLVAFVVLASRVSSRGRLESNNLVPASSEGDDAQRPGRS